MMENRTRYSNCRLGYLIINILKRTGNALLTIRYFGPIPERGLILMCWLGLRVLLQYPSFLIELIITIYYFFFLYTFYLTTTYHWFIFILWKVQIYCCRVIGIFLFYNRSIRIHEKNCLYNLTLKMNTYVNLYLGTKKKKV